MDLNTQKERFSDAYIHAVAAVAGCDVMKPPTDIDSIDWVLHARGITGAAFRAPRLKLQLKATSTDTVDANYLRFPLKIKNYDDLRPDNVLVPRILVVLVLPSDELTDWLNLDEERMLLKRCAYWTSLCGGPEMTNTTTVTVPIPRTQVFSPGALRGMMVSICDRGSL